MSVFVEKSGVLSTIQDLGRNGYRRFGINPNGAMDKIAVRLINVLLGNDENAPVLEMHFPAPVLRFERAAVFALGGADFGATLDNVPIENWRLIRAAKNQTLKFADRIFGNRAYLSIKGGLAIDRWLGSAATNLIARVGGVEGRSLRKGDQLFFDSEFQIQNSKFPYRISDRLLPRYASPTARVVAGAEYEKLTGLSEQQFLKSDFAVGGDSDRMGFRLTGAPLHLIEKTEMVSSAVDFGTVQLLPGGQMIVLMADHQTSGGYPRLAHVVAADLPILAQRGAGDAINFQMISLAEAEDLTLDFERDLNLLKIGVDSKLC